MKRSIEKILFYLFFGRLVRIFFRCNNGREAVIMLS